jgi:O-antigen/teichoic acid export membrane protein
LIREATPVGLAAVFSVMFSRIDKVILSRTTTFEAVGWYNAAYILVQGTMDVAWSSFQKVIYPILSRVSKTDERLAAFTRLLVVGFTTFFLLICLITTLLAPEITSLLFRRPDMAGTADALRVLIWIAPLTVGWAIYRNVQLVKGRQHMYAVITGIGVVVNSLSVLVLVSLVGWVGAAYAAILTQFVVLVATFFDVRPTCSRLWPGRELAKLAVVAVGILVVMVGLHRGGVGPLLVTFVTVPAYMLGVITTGVVGRSDLRLVQQLL